MKTGLSRRVRRGIVDCVLMSHNFIFALLEISTRSRNSGSRPVKIMVLRTAALGDFMMSVPALRRLRAAYPDATITLLTASTTDRATLRTVEKYAAGESPWLDLLPAGTVDEIVTFSARSWRKLRGGESKLDGQGYDRCFILNEGIGPASTSVAKKVFFLRLLGLRCRIFGIRIRAFPKIFPSVQIGPRRLEHHVTALMRSVEEDPRVAATPDPEIYFGLFAGVEYEKWADEILGRLEIGKGEMIVVAPGSRLEFKRWPTGYFVDLITKLLKQSQQAKVMLVGSGPELDTVKAVLAACHNQPCDCSRLIDMGGQTSIPQLAALLRRAAVFVGNDGGICHLAAAVGCPVVSIANGAEVPESVEPWGSQRYTARCDVPCAPCYCFTDCPRGDNRCVTGIRPELVLGLIRRAHQLDPI